MIFYLIFVVPFIMAGDPRMIKYTPNKKINWARPMSMFDRVRDSKWTVLKVKVAQSKRYRES